MVEIVVLVYRFRAKYLGIELGWTENFMTLGTSNKTIIAKCWKLIDHWWHLKISFQVENRRYMAEILSTGRKTLCNQSISIGKTTGPNSNLAQSILWTSLGAHLEYMITPPKRELLKTGNMMEKLYLMDAVMPGMFPSLIFLR